MAVDTTYNPPCAKRPEVYLDERFQSPPAHAELTETESALLRDQLATVRRECARCSFLFDCLYRAVVEVDVFGYAACTTAADRDRIRSMLGIEIRTAVDDRRVDGGPVDHATVVAARRSYPHDTFGELAARLGCSLSTVKRHLRRARQSATVAQPSQQCTPTVEEVLDCFDQLEASRCA